MTSLLHNGGVQPLRSSAVSLGFPTCPMSVYATMTEVNSIISICTLRIRGQARIHGMYVVALEPHGT